jgi:hypothetical protein
MTPKQLKRLRRRRFLKHLRAVVVDLERLARFLSRPQK